MEEGQSVRSAEAMVKQYLARQGKTEKSPAAPDGKTLALRVAAERMQSALGTKVTVKQGGKKGKIEIEFYSPEDLERLLTQIAGHQA